MTLGTCRNRHSSEFFNIALFDIVQRMFLIKPSKFVQRTQIECSFSQTKNIIIFLEHMAIECKRVNVVYVRNYLFRIFTILLIFRDNHEFLYIVWIFVYVLKSFYSLCSVLPCAPDSGFTMEWNVRICVPCFVLTRCVVEGWLRGNRGDSDHIVWSHKSFVPTDKHLQTRSPLPYFLSRQAPYINDYYELIDWTTLLCRQLECLG